MIKKESESKRLTDINNMKNVLSNRKMSMKTGRDLVKTYVVNPIVFIGKLNVNDGDEEKLESDVNVVLTLQEQIRR